jgi:hypothetical protein
METEGTKDNGGNGKQTALAVVQPSQRAALTMTYEPRDINEGITLAGQLARSCLLGRNLDTPEKVFAIIVAGRELGLSPMTSLRSIHLVEGKPVMAADTIIGLVRASGLCETLQLVEGTDRVATYEAKRRDTGDTARITFSWADAERAGLAGKDNWRKYPATMLRHRAAAMVARELFPDVVLNVYEQGEEDEIRGTVRPVEPTPPARITPAGATSTPRTEPKAAHAPAHVDPTPTTAPPPRVIPLPGGSAIKVTGGPMPNPPTVAAPPKAEAARQPAPTSEPKCGHYKLHIPKVGTKTFAECTAEELGSFIGWQESMRDRGEWKPEYAEKNARSIEIAREWRAWREAQAASAAPPSDDEPPPVGDVDLPF